jgi:hypothetical protein
MAKTATAEKESATIVPVDSGTEDLLKKAQEAAARTAKAKAEFQEAQKFDKEMQAKAHEAIQAVAGPLIDQVKALRAKADQAKAEHKTEVESRKSMDAEYKAFLASIETDIDGIVAGAAALGIQEGMVRGTHRRPKGAASASEKGSRKNLKLSEIGEVGPVEVEAIRRTGDGVATCTVVYEIVESGDGSFEVYAKRVDDKDGISEEKKAGGYTHQSNSLSKVTTSPGWHETADVQYALLAVSNKLDEFPSVHPTNAASSITAGGGPVPEFEGTPETVVEETV